jgi:myo-inositol catabolism protein IolC
MQLGYDQPLYILPFDHRPPYAAEVFGFQEPMGPGERAGALAAKQVIYDAFKAALVGGVARDRAGILVDTLYAAPILRDAGAAGLLTVMPVEKSGHSEFDFEAGDDFVRNIETYQPTFVKSLLRYNPDGDGALNVRQLGRLKRLSDVCRTAGRRHMLELIVPPEPEQLAGDAGAFDRDVRPGLMARAMHAIQDAGIEADVWKIEGLERRTDCVLIADAARRGGRDRVGLVVLGRGEDERRVRSWLEAAAGVPGFIGFAVGRTTFADPVVEWRAGRLSRERAVAEIARRFRAWVDVFADAAG